MGFVLTAALGIVDSLIAGFVGEAPHWYAAGQGAECIALIVAAVVLLAIVATGWKGGMGAREVKRFPSLIRSACLCVEISHTGTEGNGPEEDMYEAMHAQMRGSDAAVFLRAISLARSVD